MEIRIGCGTSLLQSLLQAEPFFFAATKIRIGRGPRCRYGRCRRAILYRHEDCAASIRKFGLEIKNRCTKEGVNRQNPASIRKSGPEIKNRCTQEGLNREKLASIPKSEPEIKNRCTQQSLNGGKQRGSSPARVYKKSRPGTSQNQKRGGRSHPVTPVEIMYNATN